MNRTDYDFDVISGPSGPSRPAPKPTEQPQHQQGGGLPKPSTVQGIPVNGGVTTVRRAGGA